MRVRILKRGRLRLIIVRYLFALVAGLVVSLYAYWVLGPPGYMTLAQRQRQERALEEEMRALTKENRRLADRIRALQDDPAAIERLAREEFGYVRDGEISLRQFRDVNRNLPAREVK